MSRLLAVALVAALPPSLTAQPADAEFFEKRVRPVLAEKCYGCHSGQAREIKSGLRLDSRAGLLKGGARGPAVVPGAPEKSRLVEAISYKNVDLAMPPRGRLSERAIDDLTAWVKAGAPWPGEAAVAVDTKPGFDLQKRKAEHWAWQPVRPARPPAVRDTNWPLAPADRFILAKLEAAVLRPAPPTDRAAWLRRVTFDLTGLPPTPQEIDAFLKDDSPAAFALVVDRLLASPHFGERWARHWLDLVRYAETKGHEFDAIIPNAYQYRDYVIRALNADVPYNQFVTEHIAGDLLREPRMSSPDGFNESILGTGFWFLNEEVHSPVDIRADECDRFDNKIDVFSKTFLGLTVACARCHDHKFDAISQKDYYALSGFLLSSSYRQVRFDSMEHNRRIDIGLKELSAKHRGAILEVLADTMKPGVGKLKENLLAARAAIRSGKPGDTDIVRAWVKHLKAAQKEPSDPFHLWADLCAVDDVHFSQRVEAIEAKQAKLAAESEDFEDPCEVIRFPDFVTGHAWEAGDVGFSSADVMWSTDRARPIGEVRALYGPQQRDPFWNHLAVAPGTETDHGALGAKPRCGRVLRSANFTLTRNKVFVSAFGRGRLYAAVDSHTLIAGPLHGRLVQDFDTAGQWQWVALDLTPYKGHRLHLEAWPTDAFHFGVGLVGQGEAPPKVFDFVIVPQPVPLKTTPLWTTIDGLAGDYQRWFEWILRYVHDGGADQVPFAPNFALDHPELFGIKDFSRVIEAAKPLFDERARFSRQVRRESRLAPAMWDGNGVDDRIHIRGSHKSLGAVARRSFLEALVGSKSITNESSSGRLELARQVTDPAINPLIARVIVNRVWHHLFGRGIVASVDNFGVMGERPTHPELLDYLADRFVREGWSLKKLIRELVLSQTYRMASRGDVEAADPENKLLYAMRLKRLEGEAIRDSMLALAGRLDETMFGAPVPIYLGNIPEARGKPPVDGPLDGAGRRSVYIAVRRNFLSPFMLAFDTPAPFSTMGRRTVSNVPAQALILMNDPFVHQQAERWGRRIAAEPGDAAAKVERMYQSAFARRPSAEELARSRAFVESRRGNERAWGDLAHVLFNVKEFIYLP